MENPGAIHLTPTQEVEAKGWAAEARDKDGHLVSTTAWLDGASVNDNLKSLGQFIDEYDGKNGTTVQVFAANITL